VSSNQRRASVYVRFHCPARGASSRGAPCSLCLACLSCSILSQVGLLEVLAAYLGSLGYFLARGLLLLNGYSLERLMLMGGGGSRVCSLLSLVLYPKHVHFASLTLIAKY
jgi:hypothetical protein